MTKTSRGSVIDCCPLPVRVYVFSISFFTRTYCDSMILILLQRFIMYSVCFEHFLPYQTCFQFGKKCKFVAFAWCLFIVYNLDLFKLISVFSIMLQMYY